ncbi:MAG: SPFH domain-containing protein, partial [Thermoanaerobaculia bacterium]
IDHRTDLVVLYAEAAARQYLAGNPLEDLLTVGREAIEEGIHRTLEQRLNDIGAGVAITAVRVVDVHPPSGAVFAFRDVSSAREERETRIHRAHEVQARDVPLARGEAAVIVARSQSAADAAVTEAAGRSRAFVAQAEAMALERRILEHLLRVEAAERLFPGLEKFIIPPGTAGPDVSLWRDETQRRDEN